MTRACVLLALALLALLRPLPVEAQQTSATGRVADGVVPQPIAVMPFRNLNQDPGLDWLAVGMAETMLSDLRREGMKIVMRDTLDTAIAEMALQGVRATDESTAARVGRLAGAKTMVFGGYQTAGGQVRITARFVEVETSLVLDAAMATGPLTSILALQDEIVSKMLGRPPSPPVLASAAPSRTDQTRPGAGRRGSGATPPAQPPAQTQAQSQETGSQETQSGAADVAARPPAGTARPTGERTVEAYRLYAMSLSTRSDADRIDYLQRSLEIDDTFVYAVEDLRALEQRLTGHRQRSIAALHDRASSKLDIVLDENQPPETRSQLAIEVLGDHLVAQRYRSVVEAGRQIYDLDLPRVGNVYPAEVASFSIFQAYQQLGEIDLALQIGERHLERFPASIYAPGLSQLMLVLIQRKEQSARRRVENDRELERLVEREAEIALLSNPQAMVVQTRVLALDRCRLLHESGRHEEALVACESFLREHRDAMASMLSAAVLFKLRSFGEQRRFSKGRAWSEAILLEHPQDEVRDMIRNVVTWWPME